MRLVGIDAVFARMTRLKERVDDNAAVLNEGGQYLLDSIRTNFEVSGRPRRWRMLAESTLAGRRRRGTGDTPLVETGALRDSVHIVMQGDSEEIGTDAVQANRLHYGYPGGAGRGHAKTPARPFVMIQSWDIDKVGEIFSRHYKN